jgi:N-acetyl-anhydromuramyl-L-alanine amidase AmpD
MKQSKIHQNPGGRNVDPTTLLRKVSVATGMALLATIAGSQASTDYGPAIWRPTCNANYYTSGYGHKFHVVHDMEGYYASVISTFTSCGYTAASVQYATNGKKDTSSDYAAGEITQMVRDSQYAWHARCWNQHSTGTEHEGFVSNPAWYTEEQYQASAGITRNLANKFGWAKDRNHVIGHDQKRIAGWPAYASANLGIDPYCNSHTDPGVYWDWSHYMALVNGGGTSYGQRAFNQPVSNQADGRLSVYSVAADTSPWSSSMTAINGPFGPWSSHGGGAKAGVVSARQPDGRQIIFVIGTTSQVYVQYQLSANGGWSGWQLLGGWVLSLSVAQNADGRLQLFMVGTDQQVWTTSQTGPNSNASFTGWSSFGENVQPGISTANHADGRIQFFMIGTDQHLYTWWQNAPNSGAWTRGAWGGWILSVDAGRRSDGRIQIFMVGTDQQVWHVSQQAANANSWSGWSSFGENVQPGIGVATRAAGGLQFFLVGTDSHVYTWWDENGVWTRGALGGTVKPGVAVGINPDGRLSIFGVGRDDGAIYTAWQNSVTGPYSGWASMGSAGGGFSSLFGSN